MSKENQIEEMTEILRFGDCIDVGITECRKFDDCNVCKATRLYNAGYRKSEWISVDERLPEGEITVLGYTPSNGEIHDYIVDTKKRWWGYDGWGTPHGFGITQWMPLPDAPKGGAE